MQHRCNCDLMVLEEKMCRFEKKFLRLSTRFITGHKESQFAAQSRNVLIIFQLIINFTRKKGRYWFVSNYCLHIRVCSNIYCTKWPSQFLLIEINWFHCLFWSKQKDVVYPFNLSFFCKHREECNFKFICCIIK